MEKLYFSACFQHVKTQKSMFPRFTIKNIFLCGIFTAGNHVTTKDALHSKIQINDVTSFVFFPCENKMQLCVKAAEKPAFPQLFCVFLRKLQIFLDLRKTCVFYKTAAEKLHLFL